MLWLILLMGSIVVSLIWWEYSEHDCLPHKSCNNSVSKPQRSDDPLVSLDKIKGMVRNNSDFVTWRLALVAGIIAALPIVYYLEYRIPSLLEWIIVGGLVFMATYLSSSWIWAHFFSPNGIQIEKSLVELRDKIHTITSSSSKNKDILESPNNNNNDNFGYDPGYIPGYNLGYVPGYVPGYG